MTTDKSPDFTPSMLHNRRGPMQATPKSRLALLPASFAEFLLDRRVLALFCVFLPPVAVFIQSGLNRKFALSIVLSLFFWFPGKLDSFLHDNLPLFLGVLFAFYILFLEKAVNPSDEAGFSV